MLVDGTSQKCAKSPVELVAHKTYLPAAAHALEPDVHSDAGDLPLVRATRMLLLEPYDVTNANRCDGYGQGVLVSVGWVESGRPTQVARATCSSRGIVRYKGVYRRR